MSRYGAFVVLPVLLIGVAGCAEGPGGQGYEQEVLQERVQRDMQMRQDESVLPPDRRQDFKGLDYFAVDTTYRFVVPFHRKSAPDTVMLPQSTGRIGEQVQVGDVVVPLPSGVDTFTVFRGAGDDPRGRLWMPFADATNDTATYKAGRYVDLQRQAEDSVLVDFNRAYNPTCAYNPEYTCPLPPPENHLDAALPAGEKRPKFQSRGAAASSTR